MSDLVKALYRNDGLKAEAYKNAEATFKLLDPALFVNPNALRTFCDTASASIIQESITGIISNASKTVKAHGGKLDPKNIETVMHAMTDLFIDEMQSTAAVAMIDIKSWSSKAETMGANPEMTAKTIAAAWTTGTPALFLDFKQRVKQAIDGYINSSLQILILHGNAA